MLFIWKILYIHIKEHLKLVHIIQILIQYSTLHKMQFQFYLEFLRYRSGVNEQGELLWTLKHPQQITSPIVPTTMRLTYTGSVQITRDIITAIASWELSRKEIYDSI